MLDIVFPDGNEKEFIELAERLGLEGLCFVYKKKTDISGFQQQTRLSLSTAVLCRPEDVRRFKGKVTTIVEAPEDQTKLRHIIEQVRPDILYGLETGRKKDFIHHRASGLNHILAALARQKKVAIGFSFSVLLKAKPQQRAIYMGRIMQNMRFAGKFKFEKVIASFADDPWQMRSVKDITSFFQVLGMTAAEVKTSFWRG